MAQPRLCGVGGEAVSDGGRACPLGGAAGGAESVVLRAITFSGV
jgi:hypothetical protein